MNPSNSLELKTERFNQVKSGKKTATLRDGKVNCQCGPGEIVDSSDKNNKVKINITKVSTVTFGKLNESHLKENNYSSVKEMKNTLKSVYPHLTEDSEVTNVVFSVVK